MKKFLPVVTLVLGLVLPAVAADKKQADTKQAEPGITREQADEILKELRQIRQLLEKGAKAAPATVLPDGKVRMNLEGANWLGSKDAPLTMVEFTDYQCGYCQKFHTATFPEIRKKFIDTGKVRFVSRDLPLDFHSNAARAAESARCAGDQGQFWPMRDKLVANATQLSPEQINGYARDLSLNMQTFQACVESGKHRDEVQGDAAIAQLLRIDGTPGFVIGKSTPEGVEGSVVLGALPLDAFEAKLESMAR